MKLWSAWGWRWFSPVLCYLPHLRRKETGDNIRTWGSCELPSPANLGSRIIGWNPHHCFQEFSLFPQTVFSAKSKSRSVRDVNRKTKVFSHRSTCFEVHSYSLWDQDRNNSVTPISQFQSHSPLSPRLFEEPKVNLSIHSPTLPGPHVCFLRSGAACTCKPLRQWHGPAVAQLHRGSQSLLWYFETPRFFSCLLATELNVFFPFIQHMYAVAV